MPITTLRKVTIAFPAHILHEIEETAKKKRMAVDKLIRRVVENSLQQDKKINLSSLLREGYLLNANRDAAIAEEFKFADAEVDRQLDLQERENESKYAGM